MIYPLLIYDHRPLRSGPPLPVFSIGLRGEGFFAFLCLSLLPFFSFLGGVGCSFPLSFFTAVEAGAAFGLPSSSFGIGHIFPPPHRPSSGRGRDRRAFRIRAPPAAQGPYIADSAAWAEHPEALWPS